MHNWVSVTAVCLDDFGSDAVFYRSIPEALNYSGSSTLEQSIVLSIVLSIGPHLNHL